MLNAIFGSEKDKPKGKPKAAEIRNFAMQQNAMMEARK